MSARANPFPLSPGALSDRDIAFFRRGDVDVFALAGYHASPHETRRPYSVPMDLGFRVQRWEVCFSKRGRFSYADDARVAPDDAEPAYVLPAIEGGLVVDAVAWQPSGRVATLYGRAGLLGADALDTAARGEPVVIHADPRAWLAAWRTGVVIVDEALARPRLLAARCPLQVGSIAQGEALDRMLRKVRIPQIVVPTDTILRATA